MDHIDNSLNHDAKDKIIEELRNSLDEKLELIMKLRKSDNVESVEAMFAMISDKNEIIAALRNTITDKNALINSHLALIDEKDFVIQDKRELVESKNYIIHKANEREKDLRDRLSAAMAEKEELKAKVVSDAKMVADAKTSLRHQREMNALVRYVDKLEMMPDKEKGMLLELIDKLQTSNALQLSDVIKKKEMLFAQLDSFQADYEAQLDTLSYLNKEKLLVDEREERLRAEINGLRADNTRQFNMISSLQKRLNTISSSVDVILKQSTDESDWESETFSVVSVTGDPTWWAVKMHVNPLGDDKTYIALYNRDIWASMASGNFVVFNEYRTLCVTTYEPTTGKGVTLMATEEFIKRVSGCNTIKMQVEITVHD